MIGRGLMSERACAVCGDLKWTETDGPLQAFDFYGGPLARVRPLRRDEASDSETYLHRCPSCGIYYVYSWWQNEDKDVTWTNHDVIRLSPAAAVRLLTPEERTDFAGRGLPETVACLRRELEGDDRDARLNAARELAGVAVERAEPGEVAALLRHPDVHVRFGALSVLNRLPSELPREVEEALDGAIEQLRRDAPDWRRIQARALAWFLFRRDPRRVMELLGDPDVQVRSGVLDALSGAGDLPEVVREALRDLKESRGRDGG